jgi:hypothetical protein
MRRMTKSVLSLMFGIAATGLVAIFPTISRAHCDTLDGPVVTEAKAALEKGDVTPVLKWVNVKDENEIKTVFKKVLAARSAGKEAKEVADLHFFETLVRVHRAGEGAAFTGLEPAGTIEPAVAAADKAIEVGSVDELAKEIGQSAEKAVRDRFGRLMSAKKHKDESVGAGREYVGAYVEYVHFVEGLHNTVTAARAHHEHAK